MIDDLINVLCGIIVVLVFAFLLAPFFVLVAYGAFKWILLLLHLLGPV